MTTNKIHFASLMVKHYLKLLFCGGNTFYPFELSLLEKVKLLLDKDMALLLQKQINSVNKIQRLTDGKEVNLYRM
jgi:hypothetical protein